MENQISVKCTYIESIHNMRKPVISSEISPKFDGVPTTDTLPESQISSDYRYHIFHRKSKKQTPSKGFALIKKRYHNNFYALISTDL